MCVKGVCDLCFFVLIYFNLLQFFIHLIIIIFYYFGCFYSYQEKATILAHNITKCYAIVADSELLNHCMSIALTKRNNSVSIRIIMASSSMSTCIVIAGKQSNEEISSFSTRHKLATK